MKLQLKENPIEWLKFTVVIGSMIGLVWTLGAYKGWHVQAWWWGWIPGLAGTACCAAFPKYFRGFYRTGTTFFFHVGQVMGKVMLTAFFVLIATPLGLALRATGKDLLKLKKNPNTDTYWRSPGKTGGHDKMF